MIWEMNVNYLRFKANKMNNQSHQIYRFQKKPGFSGFSLKIKNRNLTKNTEL